MKTLMMLIAGVFLFVISPLIADTETVDDYTWTYRLNGETAEIYKGSFVAAISPMPTGAVKMAAIPVIGTRNGRQAMTPRQLPRSPSGFAAAAASARKS